MVRFLDRLNQNIGSAISWLNLVMVGVTFTVVILRYGFGVGWVWLQEIVVYSHAIIFMTGAGYTFLKGGHVRVDILLQKFSDRVKAWIEIFGVVGLLFPMVSLLFYQALPYVVDSWKVLEGSKDGGGLEAVFILKSFILVFCLLLFLQGVSQVLKSIDQIKPKAKGRSHSG